MSENNILHFITAYGDSDISRFHMPGHKGNFEPLNALGSLSRYDITEIEGADVLGSPTGIIETTEARAASLFETKHSVISTQGSTLCIQTMTAIMAKQGGHILAARNCHVAFINGCAIHNLQPVWLYPSSMSMDGLAEPLTVKQVEDAFASVSDIRSVYVTSPDYFGRTVDIAGISAVCKEHGALLFVDGAHGAHLKFMNQDSHPIALGADFCCDSLHKTLPALTGAALLHCGNEAFTKQDVKSMMNVFASTSPSYLTMLSIDLCLQYMQNGGIANYQKLERRTHSLGAHARLNGFSVLEDTDCTKLVLDAYSVGYTGHELAAALRHCQMEPEYTCGQFVILLITPFNKQKDFNRLTNFIEELEKRSPIEETTGLHYQPLEAKFPLQQGLYRPSRQVSMDEAAGCIAAEAKIACPPGIPVVIPGEEIPSRVSAFLKSTGICTITVLK